MQNNAAIRSAVLEKMTCEVAIFRSFPDIPDRKLSLPFSLWMPDVTLLGYMSCRVTVLVLFVSVKQEARRSFG